MSEIWKLVSANLHEAAGNIRIFVHPEVDILTRARLHHRDAPILDSKIIEQELMKVFKT